MKLYIQERYDNLSKQNFKGQRVNKRIVRQLAQNNKYSLTEPNQRYISDAITQLGRTPGKKTIDFLLKTAENLKYHFSNALNFKYAPINNWKEMLLVAAASSAIITQGISLDKYKNRIKEISDSEEISPEEKNIMELRDSIIKKIDLEKINSELKGPMQNFEENLDYFIVSSETTLKDKKTILEKLDFFLSDEYKINPQLEDKKSIAAAEIINDIAIDVPGNKIPNIKAINQKQHGMCGAISIVRKKLAYENKVDFVNLIMSELDNTNRIEVYDRTKLGTGKKTYVDKIPLDFETAMKQGYRIIDTSTLYWMQISSMTGSSNVAYDVYYPFDKSNFDVNKDQFYNVSFNTEYMQNRHSYYQALSKAKEVIENYKAQSIKKQVKINESNADFNKNLPVMTKTMSQINEKIRLLAPDRNKSEINSAVHLLIGLEHKYSNSIKKDDIYSYIPNEEECVKKDKTKNFLRDFLGISDIEDKDIDEIYNLVEFYNSISKDKVAKLSKKSKALSLYKVGAAYRYQFIKSLDNENILDNYIYTNGLPNREILIEETIKKYIHIIKNNEKLSDTIIKEISQKVNEIEPTKESVLNFLKTIESTCENIIDNFYSNILNSVGLKDCNEGLILYMDLIKNEIALKHKESYMVYAENLGIYNEDELYDTLNFLQQEIPRYGKRGFAEVYRMLGGASQLNLIYYILAVIEQKIQEGDATIIDIVRKVNNLPENTAKEDLFNVIQNLRELLASSGTILSNFEDILKIHNKDGEIIDSASAKDLIIKKFENKGLIPKEKDLKILQEHMEQIEKEAYADEFLADRNKKSNNNIEFSKEEKIFLNTLEKSINKMYADVKRQLESVKKYGLKGSLEELNRIVGFNNGKYWISEGHSGLMMEQEIRILEYATGHPYHSTNNMNDVIKKVKTSPFSAITSSSVYHDNVGMHAQYVADISPVKINIHEKDGSETSSYKDVLYHDNTWGVSEHDNTWKDSFGLQRTDYKDRRGGTLGYITNSKYRNGNLVDRIKGDMFLEEQTESVNNKVYKKIKGMTPRLPMKTTQYQESLIEGISSKTSSDANNFEREILNYKEDVMIGKIENFAKKHTKEEILTEINKIKTTAKNFYPNYQQIKNRILSKEFDKIKTKEDYANIDEKIRLLMDKVALAKSGDIVNYWYKIAKARSFKELDAIKEAQRQEAMDSFKYAFSKNDDQIKYGLYKAYLKLRPDMLEALKNEKIKPSAKELKALFKDLNSSIANSDGSLKNDIDKIANSLQKNLEALNCQPETAKSLSDKYKEELRKSLYLNKNDINTPQLYFYINFIDKNFDPFDDKELISIYRKIQDYTNEQFDAEIVPLITNDDLNYGKISGYDIFKKIRDYDYSAKQDLMNMVYQQALISDWGDAAFKKSYTNHKLHRKPLITESYNFRNSYEDLSESLAILNLSKLMKDAKNKYFQKEEVYPAYPLIDYMPKEIFDKNYANMISAIKYKVDSIQAYYLQAKSYKIEKSLTKYLEKLSPSDTLTEFQYKNIRKMVSELMRFEGDGDNINDIIAASSKILQFKPDEKWESYIPLVYSITSAIVYYEYINSKEEIMQLIKKEKQTLDNFKNNVISLNIQKKYQNNYHKLLNDYRLSLIKGKMSLANDLLDKLYKDFYKMHIYAKPEEVLQNYLLSIAKDSDTNEFTEHYKTYLRELLSYAQLGVVQEMIMDAISNGNEMEIKNALLKNSKDNLSEEIVYIVDSLIVHENIETASIMLEKLGLGETYVKEIGETLEKIMNKAIKKMKKTDILVSDYEKFKDEYRQLINNFDFLNVTDEFSLDNLELMISKTIKDCKLPKEITKIFQETFNEYKNLYMQKEDINRSLLFLSMLDEALNASDEKISYVMADLDDLLYKAEIHLNLINSIYVKDRTKADGIKKHLNSEYSKLIEVYDTLKNLHA